MRHLTKNQPAMETREDKVAKEIIDTYKKFGIDNANPTRAIMRRTGVNVEQATQLVIVKSYRLADTVIRMLEVRRAGN